MGLSGKKCLFFVQGEGRGHMTQSISMRQVLESAGMEVCEVIMSKSHSRGVPPFYFEKINAPVTTIESPSMVISKTNKGIKPLVTFLKNVSRVRLFWQSLKVIHSKINEHNPDLVINFFEPLCGMYYLFYKPRIPMISIAHHFLYNHPEFEMPQGHPHAKRGLKFYTWLTSLRAKKRLALSFYPMEHCPHKSIFVVPPLLREEVTGHPTAKGDYLLVYLLNHGYMDDIKKWHVQNPGVVLHCFIDKKGMEEVEQYDETLFVHRLNDTKFVDMMANARAVVSTAGFESVCEAMYMGKPVLMVPVEKHYEQYCNSCDAVNAGAGIYSKTFSIDKLFSYMAARQGNKQDFKEWAGSAPDLILRQVYAVLHNGNNVKSLFTKPVLSKKIG